MKKLFLVLAACVMAFSICGCKMNPDECTHEFTEFMLCKKCGYYDGFDRFDEQGRRPKISWTLGENVYLEFMTGAKGNYKLILSCSKSGLPHESWNECVENLKCFDRNGNEIKLFTEESSNSVVTLSELNANECYYLSFKYVKEPVFYPNPDPEWQKYVDELNEDKTAIYFWIHLVED